MGPGGGSGGSGNSYQVFSAKKQDTPAAFSGSGHTLGAPSQEGRMSLLGSWRGKASQKKGEESLTDRREKAKRAALARMEGDETE